MRAHVEVDTTVKLTCVSAGIELAKEFAGVCDVQITGNAALSNTLMSLTDDFAPIAFMQDPLFESSDDSEPGENLTWLKKALVLPDVRVVGSAPYVEHTLQQQKKNVDLILSLAMQHGIHADFHLVSVQQ